MNINEKVICCVDSLYLKRFSESIPFNYQLTPGKTYTVIGMNHEGSIGEDMILIRCDNDSNVWRVKKWFKSSRESKLKRILK